MNAEDCLCPGLWSPFLRADGRETGLRFTLERRRGGKVTLRPANAAVPVPSPEMLMSWPPLAASAPKY